MRPTSGKQIIADFFDNFEVDYVFGNPGTTEATFLDLVSTSRRCQFILGLHESTAVGIAAGYALKSGKPAVVNIHTYPGLANAMCNMFNSYASGIPMVVIAGQQNRHHLVHRPILSGELTELASTASVSQYQVERVGDMSTILQRSYMEASEAKAPSFVSIPMEVYQDETDNAEFKKTKVLMPECATEIERVAECIRAAKGSVAIVADSEALWAEGLKRPLRLLSEGADADLYLAPFPVVTMVDVTSPKYKGLLPLMSDGANAALSRYDVIVLLGEKIQSFLYVDKPTIPRGKTLVQFSSGNTIVRYDRPAEFVVRGDITANVRALLRALGLENTSPLPDRKEQQVTPSILASMLKAIPRETPVVIEGSSHGSREEAMVMSLNFREVYSEPRGGGLGLAMPLAVGVALHSKKPSVCVAGDGGSLYSIHAIWTAARYRIPVVFLCVVNNEYQILKQLWKKQVPESTEAQYRLIMDFNDPPINIGEIAKGFGAIVHHATKDNCSDLVQQALQHPGPTFITLPDDRRYTE
jgi:benzoylformate decarboxylase